MQSFLRPKLHRSHSAGSLELSSSFESTSTSPNPIANKKCTILDAASKFDDTAIVAPKLPLASFNHIAREVISLPKSKAFYCDILGFVVIPRPMFDCDGYWLWGYGLSLHLVETSNKLARRDVLEARMKHFAKALPRVDHT